ncbi:putative defense protein Hdd11 [Sitodiplosis mosellana]|uniref:putative defense protein Hdd11 n=1 Tax=Sitodiplosis mosellana TaxID=263140 RepID=UPI002444BF12|nr:putative defense protein Hdd11 [Sitodiplosis mosellana]
MFCRAFVTIALICAIPSAYSYSAGAPSAACEDMVPQHHVDPQRSTPPYKMLLSSKGDTVHVKIQGNSAGDTIKGFMIQARKDGKPIGKFEVPTEFRKHAQPLTCSGPADALTHKKIFANGPNKIEADWTPPPGFKGDVKFVATVALNGGIFWVQAINEPMSIA